MVRLLLVAILLVGCEYPTGAYAPTWRCTREIHLDTLRVAMGGEDAIRTFCAKQAGSPIEYTFCRMRIRSQGDTAYFISRKPDDCWISYFPQGHRPGQPDRF